MCVALNEAGTDQFEIGVDVRQKPKVILPDPEVDVFQGRSLILECSIEGRPDPVIVWKRDGRVLSSSLRIYVSPDKKRLQIFSMKIADAGTYSCHADNIVGSGEDFTKVTVLQSPELLESYQSIEKVTFILNYVLLYHSFNVKL